MNKFKQEFKEMFDDDYIRIGKKVIRPYSVLWWFVSLSQGLLGASCVYVFYILMWLVLG